MSFLVPIPVYNNSNPSSRTTRCPLPFPRDSHLQWESGIEFSMQTSVVTMILDVVDGADVATKEGSEDVICLYPTYRSCCGAVTE